ncbi:hypothetical protein [Tellurirhabdus bombi]|uniref:hypothetical protein n=1 Tax=Tellurirhabdus bombi TaxID=2907205 RepID=UPI001F492B9D|nr:hypothetical protein [Tellurirhabdus bombi]
MLTELIKTYPLLAFTSGFALGFVFCSLIGTMIYTAFQQMKQDPLQYHSLRERVN